MKLKLDTELGNVTIVSPDDKNIATWMKYIELDIPVTLNKQELHFLPAGS